MWKKVTILILFTLLFTSFKGVSANNDPYEEINNDYQISYLSENSLNLKWDTDCNDNENFYFKKDNGEEKKAIANCYEKSFSEDRECQMVLSGLEVNTLYNYASQCGSSSYQFENYFTTLENISDSSVNVTNISDSSATINWQTSQALRSKVFYYPENNSFIQETVLNSNKVTKHSVVLDNLSPNTKYKYQITSSSKDGGVISNYLYFTTLDMIELPDLIISNIKERNITANSAEIIWNTNINSNTWVEYGKTSSYGNAVQVDNQSAVTSHSATLNYLEENTKYFYRVSSRDELFSEASVTETGEFSTVIESNSLPDFIISDLKIEQRTRDIGKYIYITVKNIGKDVPEPNHIVSISIKDLDTGHIYSSGVTEDFPAGYMKEVPTAYVIENKTSNVYRLQATVDTGNTYGESNENNNTFEKTIIINNDDPIITNNTTEDTSTNSTVIVNNNTNNQTNNLILKLTRKISALENQVIALEKKLTVLDSKFAEKYAGTMFLDVENNGHLWYVDPESKNRYYFENGKGALSIGSKLATGITYENIQAIPIGVPDKLYNLKDSDSDGLPDKLESAIGTDVNNTDTDGDGISDKDEINNGYNPLGSEKYSYNQSLIDRFEGKMLLQVSGPNSHGEIWYIHDGKRWYGGTEDSMYEIMKAKSLGATPENIRKIAVGEVETE